MAGTCVDGHVEVLSLETKMNLYLVYLVCQNNYLQKYEILLALQEVGIVSWLHAAALRAHGRDAESVFGGEKSEGRNTQRRKCYFSQDMGCMMVPMISHHGD